VLYALTYAPDRIRTLNT